MVRDSSAAIMETILLLAPQEVELLILFLLMSVLSDILPLMCFPFCFAAKQECSQTARNTIDIGHQILEAILALHHRQVDQ